MREVLRATRREKMRRRRIVVFSVAGFILIALVLGIWYRLQAEPPGSPGNPIVVHIARGESSATVEDRLVSDGVVTSSTAYHFYLFFHSMPPVQRGTYAFHHNMSFGAVNQVLAEGPNVGFIRVPAGMTIRELANRVAQLPAHSPKTFMTVAQSGRVKSSWAAANSPNLEGLIAPGTYNVLPAESDRSLLRAMVTRFDQEARAAGVSPQDAARLGVTPNQLVTIASIVQKEGYIPSNMPAVARVIYNRLAKGMPLQMDSTVLYSLGRDGGQVTSADEQVDTPYNTYLHPGLPPTPVALPSTAALRAAAHPPPGSWIYFVIIDKKGDEAFTNDYQQQLTNEQLARSRGLR